MPIGVDPRRRFTVARKALPEHLAGPPAAPPNEGMRIPTGSVGV